ncbi:hypothetical protein BH11ACT8_BH11ACT8_09010 [soil metagenome]
MTGHPVRASLVFALVLVALSAVGYVVQQAAYTRPPLLDLTPSTGAQPPPDVAPAPVVARPRLASATGVPQIDPAWLSRNAAASGVPEVALRAYARAELEAPRGCGLGWTTLAGIGWVESQHGTLGDRTLGEDGHSSSPILGPALDGTGGFKAIRATAESQQWHGDPTWDHAFGPMQFISSTWSAWAADGDGDGVADPNDIDDAALAAARYLCAGGRDLRSGSGWTAGVLSYNNARVYLDAVHSAASSYAERTAA